MEERKIATNPCRRPNRGKVYSSTVEEFDKLTLDRAINSVIEAIRGGNEGLKSELPFRCPHYRKFKDDHRAQSDIIPEEFTFQTVVDYDADGVPEEKIAEEVEKVKNRALELNADNGSPWCGMLLRGSYSARKKLHFDIRIPIGKTIHETQQEYCEALGIDHDVSCETPERMIYIETEEFYRSKEWCKVLSPEETEERVQAYAERGLSADGFPIGRDGKAIYPSPKRMTSQKTVVEKVSEKQAEVAETPLDNAPQTALMAFDECTRRAGLNPDVMDVWGVHNWHQNLLSVLSVGLTKLVPSKQILLATLAQKLPNYSQTEDCQKLVDYFYERYAADKGYMSAELREINAKVQMKCTGNSNVNSAADDDDFINNLQQGWTPPELPKKLPRLIHLLVKPFPHQYHPMLVITSMVILGAIASHYRSHYLDGRTIAGNLFAAIIAGSGKGKNWVSMLFEIMTRSTIDTWDKAEWRKVKENQEMRDKMSNAKEKPAKYHPRFRVMETMSKTSLLEVQTNLGENGMVLCNYTESDELANASRQQFSNVSVLFRKAWDLAVHKQFFMTEASCNTSTRLNAAILLTGTPRSVIGRLFSDTENGMMQRFIPLIMPQLKRSFRPPTFTPLSTDEEAERDALLIKLWQQDLSLGDSTLMLEMPKTQKMVTEWYDALEEQYNDGMLTEAEADLSHRIGQHIQRAMIPFVALYGEEKKEEMELALWLGDFAFYNITHIFGNKVARDMDESKEMLDFSKDERKTAEPLLLKMPNVFTTQAFKEERLKAGQSADVKSLLSRYCKKGKLIRLSKGVYQKVESQQNKADVTVN